MSARMAGDAGLVEALRARSDKGTESVRRDMSQNGRLSMKARGILGYLLSKPDRWRTSAQAIANECEKDGREAIANGLRELEQLGYLARRRRNAGGGRFVWCWVYSDDPDEVADVLAAMDDTGSAPRRGRARKTPMLGGKPLVTPIDGKPVDGEAEPQVNTSDGKPVDGETIDGFPVDGKPVDIESKEKEIPPHPPASGGSPEPSSEEPPAGPCTEHGRRNCRDCGLSPRSRARAARDALDADFDAAEATGAACRMCRADGPSSTIPPRSDGTPATRWVMVRQGTQEPITPYRICDHARSHGDVLAEIAAAEAAAEASRRPREVVEASSPALRAQLRGAWRKRPPRAGVSAGAGGAASVAS